MKRAALILGLLAAALAWQARPLLIWHLRVAPELLGSPRAESRLHARTETSFPRAPADWRRLESGRLSLEAPLVGGAAACEACTGGCALAPRGKVTIFSGPRPPSYAETLDRLAPDASDLRLFRSRARNWLSLRAIVDRALLAGEPPETFRFGSRGSRGVVSRFSNHEIERFVIYAYSPDGETAPVIGLSGAGPESLRGMLGTLRVKSGPLAASPSRCEGE